MPAQSSTATQQQAKSMSQQHLNSKAGGKSTIYDADVTAIKDIASFMGNQANQTYNQRYQQQLKDAQYNQQMAASNQISVDRTASERQQQSKQQDFNNQKSLIQQSQSNQSKGGFLGGGATYGMNGNVDPYRYTQGSTSVNRGMFDASKQADFNLQQMNIASNNAMFSKANVAGDIALNDAQTRNQIQLSGLNQRNQIDMMNRQSSLDVQKTAQQRFFESQQAQANRDFTASESAANRGSQERLSASELASADRRAAMDAQSRVYSSMFGAFSGGGNQNYQYWGGKV